MPYWKDEIRKRLASLKLSPVREAEIVEELSQHLEDRYEESLASGSTNEEARRIALAELSDNRLLAEELRRVEGQIEPAPIVLGADRRSNMIGDIWQDLRYNVRSMLKNPGVTLIAVLTLALGIGANTAIFSVINAVLLRPLPYEASDRLVYIYDSNPSAGFPRFSSSPPNFADWRQQQQSFEYIAAFMSWSFNLTGRGEPERLTGARVSAEMFPLLGIKPLLGRTFLAEEDKAGKNRVVLLSQALWRRSFGEDHKVIGQAIMLNSESHTIIGVIPPNFQVLIQSDLYIPGGFDELTRRGHHMLKVIGRLKPGVHLQQAQTDLETIARRLEQQYPDTNKGWGVQLVPLFDVVVGDVRLALWVMLAAVGCVLLIACANVANLLLSRAVTRQREIAIRVALGASRWRIMRQLLAESVLLALTGGCLGLLLGLWGVELLISFSDGRIPRIEEVGLNQRVLNFTLLVTLMTSFISGLAPALHGSKPDLNESLKESGKGMEFGWRGKRARSLLVVVEIALSLVLLIGAGLLLKSFLRLQQVKLGFQPENALTMQISLPPAKYDEAAQRNGFYQNLLQKVGIAPGVQSAAVIDLLPLTVDSSSEFFIEGGPLQSNGLGHNTNFRRCSPDYFRTMNIPLLQGRVFNERDSADSEQVVIINETMARRFFSNADPLGKRIAFRSMDGPWHTIVGVVGDVRHHGLDSEAGLELYRPFAQTPVRAVTLVVKSTHESGSIVAAIRREVLKLDAEQPIHSIRPMAEVVARDIAPQRFNLLLLGVFAVVALLLAAIGIYGVMSYAVTERTREIGIRLALGAQSRDVLKLVLKQGMALTFVGLAIGLAVAWAVMRLLTSLLHGISSYDPITFAGVPLVLAAIAWLACYLPARRATKVDPMEALRYE